VILRMSDLLFGPVTPPVVLEHERILSFENWPPGPFPPAALDLFLSRFILM